MKQHDRPEEEPHVEIFGDSVCNDRRDGDSPVAGVIFLFAGIVLLGNTLNIVPWTVWNTVWQFWPLLIVFLGLQILLGKSFLAKVLLTILALIAVGSIALFSLQSVGSPLVQGIQLPPEITALLQMMRRQTP